MRVRSFRDQHLRGIKESGSRIEDAQKTKVLYHKYLMAECGLGVITMQTILMNIVQYELDYVGEGRASRVCMVVMNGLSGVMVWLSVTRYYLLNGLCVARVSEGLGYVGVVVEQLMILVQPYPFLRGVVVEQRDFYDEVAVQYEVNWFLNAWVMLRMYIVIRVIFYLTNYLDNRMFRISRMFGTSPGYVTPI